MDSFSEKIESDCLGVEMLEQKERTRRLGTDKEFGLLVRLSIPAVIGLFVQALYNVVDSILLLTIPR